MVVPTKKVNIFKTKLFLFENSCAIISLHATYTNVPPANDIIIEVASLGILDTDIPMETPMGREIPKIANVTIS